MSLNESSESIIQNLKDAGCDSETIENFMADLQKGKEANGPHTSHTKIRHTTINYAALGIWKRFFQFSGSLLIKRDTSSAIWHSDAL